MLGQPGEDRFYGNGGEDIIDARDGVRDFSIQCGRGTADDRSRAKAEGKRRKPRHRHPPAAPSPTPSTQAPTTAPSSSTAPRPRPKRLTPQPHLSTSERSTAANARPRDGPRGENLGGVRPFRHLCRGKDERRALFALRDLATRQHGVVSMKQLLELGYAENSSGVGDGGTAHRLHQGVYAVGHRRLTWHGGVGRRCSGPKLMRWMRWFGRRWLVMARLLICGGCCGLRRKRST